MIENLQAHWGFTTMPFGPAIPVPTLFGSACHKEAVARLRWLISAIGNHRYQNVLNDHLRETCAA
jgi:type II secretory pathway predicted ATPase ExeA